MPSSVSEPRREAADGLVTGITSGEFVFPATAEVRTLRIERTFVMRPLSRGVRRTVRLAQELRLEPA